MKWNGRKPCNSRVRSLLLVPLFAALGPNPATAAELPPPYLVVLGIAQDGGFPQAGSESIAWDDVSLRRLVASIAVIEPVAGSRYLFDATPDFKWQLQRLEEVAPRRTSRLLDGIFLTHAHTGHYMGLIHLGKEMAGARDIPIWAMPRMAGFLRSNGPFSLYVDDGNFALHPLLAHRPVRLDARLSVTPIPVPHRDEFSETVAFLIAGPNRSVLYLPDIDKWEAWDEIEGTRAIEGVLAQVDLAYLDGTFHADGEVPGRTMAEIRHPFMVESLERFGSEARRKIRFIHLNRTNPAILPDSEARRSILAAGFSIAEEGERVDL